jgi:hypothetical protein
VGEDQLPSLMVTAQVDMGMASCAAGDSHSANTQGLPSTLSGL